MKLSQKDFWKLVNSKKTAEESFKSIWNKAMERTITQEEACLCLDSLFLYSHKRIEEYSSELAKYYPTKQFTPGSLKNCDYLWWVDHYTAGISRWSTLSWFSAQKITKKNGKIGLAGACSHFVQGYHDYPFYIIPLMHGAWHEPKRNKDSISIEHVNAGQLKQHNGKWCYWPQNWTKEIPTKLVQELPPVTLDTSRNTFQSFTLDQIINNINLKRIINAALPGKLDLSRLTQHSDWRKGKSDMGQLWPLKECNDSVFDFIPIKEFAFINRYFDTLDIVGTIFEEKTIDDEQENPEYGEETPTHDNDEDSEIVLSTKEVQEILRNLNYPIKVDGVPGSKTRETIRRFQERWNIEHSDNLLVSDGIAGPLTCEALLSQTKK
jgi:hypothetical protein